MLRHVHKTSAVGVNSCENGISVCKVTQLNKGAYEVLFEYKRACGTDVEALALALSGSKLLSGDNDLLISWEPVKPSKLACWEALVAALGAVCPDATVNALPFKRREEAIEHATGRDIREEALQEVAGDSYTARETAQRFGTDLNRQLFERQSQLMLAVTKEFLRSDTCANSQEPKPTAYTQYISSGAGAYEAVS